MAQQVLNEMRYTLKLLLPIFIAFFSCFPNFSCKAEELTGSVQKSDSNRIERPNNILLPGKIDHLDNNFKIETNEFNLLNKKEILPAVPSLIDTQFKSSSILKSDVEKFKKLPTEMENTSGRSISTPVTQSNISNKQIVIVRLIYHMLDEQNVFYATKMCVALHAAGCDVILMLDKEATRVSNKHLSSGQFIARQERKAYSAPEAIQSALNAGIRVVASKEWANDFGVNEGNAIAGVELLTTEQMANEIARSSKILEY